MLRNLKKCLQLLLDLSIKLAASNHLLFLMRLHLSPMHRHQFLISSASFALQFLPSAIGMILFRKIWPQSAALYFMLRPLDHHQPLSALTWRRYTHDHLDSSSFYEQHSSKHRFGPQYAAYQITFTVLVWDFSVYLIICENWNFLAVSSLDRYFLLFSFLVHLSASHS